MGFPGGSAANNLPAMQESQEPRVPSLKIPWRRAWQPTPIFFPGESPGTEEAGGLQSMGVTESDTAERLSTHSRNKVMEAQERWTFLKLTYVCADLDHQRDTA
ncbi:hypothetical protein MG293_017772 [Ovis ammon polii]|uniref:Uncharacterized protein n=1 Tax=Ovis ammon polii TaxID=230172 RepID=A0AAD4TTW5_OVIAM|nr:hypothetical protein MG293_017772 [Ovis ammon polii]